MKFTFNSGASQEHGHDDGHDHAVATPGIPLLFAGAPSSASAVLDLRVSIVGEEVVCDGLSGDGVSYARSSKRFSDRSPAALAPLVRSVIARTGAALPEPLIASVTSVILDLGGDEAAVLTELGLPVSPGSAQLGTVDAALQARVGVNAGVPIRRA